MTRARGGEYLSSTGEQAWTWLRRHLDRADAFWLGFVLTDNLITAGILHERAQYNRRLHNQSFVDLHPATPAELAALVDRIEAESAGPGGCTWVQAVHRPDPDWEAAWNTLLQSLNHRRDYLRERLGGLVLVAPAIVKTYAQRYSADLWSVRDLLVELPTEPDEFFLSQSQSGPPSNTQSNRSQLTNVGYGPVSDELADEANTLLAMPRDALATTARDRAARATRQALAAGDNQLAALLLAARAIGYVESGDQAGGVDLVRRGLALTGVGDVVRLSLLNLASGLASGTEPRSAVDYAEQAAEIAERIADEQGTPENIAQLADYLDLLSNALGEVGDQVNAAQASQRAVAAARQLVEIDPSRHLPDLAAYLDVLGYRLNSVGHFDEATVAWREAETIYRGLVGQNLTENRPILARLLINVSNQVNVSPADALAHSQEAVAILRSLDEPDYPPDLVEALVSLRRSLALLGRTAEAVATGEEAVTLARELARSDPHAYRSWLAVALMAHGEDLADIGRQREALSAMQEAAGIHAEEAGDRDAAARLYREAAALRAEGGDPVE